MNHYCNMLLLGGQFINERYFIQVLLDNADRQTCGAWLNSWLAVELRLCPYNQPLPYRFEMANLLTTIRLQARQQGRENYMTETPQDLRRQSYPVRAIQEFLADASPGASDNLDQLIAAIQSDRGSCFLCNSKDHQLSEKCPKYLEMASNPHAKRIAGRLFGSGAGSQSVNHLTETSDSSSQAPSSESSPNA
jgi:hypothetical protein